MSAPAYHVPPTPNLSGVEVELAALFREFVESNRGRIFGVAVGDGNGYPLASHFDQPVNVGRLCGLGARLLESGAILGETLSLATPSVAILRGERYQMLLWRVPVLGGPLVGLLKRESEWPETRFKTLFAKVEAILTPPPPENGTYPVTP